MLAAMPRVPHTFGDDGYAVVADVLSTAETAAAREAADQLYAANCRPAAGVRDPIARSPVLRHTAALPAVLQLAREVLGPRAWVVRSILFDKTPAANWDVIWHQDVTIAVQEKADVPGFGPWSSKAGVPSVQPPVEVLENMVTLRIHLDDCGPNNGPLRVVPGSHKRGLIPIESLNISACDRDAVICPAAAGSVVMMRPLTLHASRKSAAADHRRVLHLEFACEPLPPPLKWYAAAQAQ